MTVALDFDGGRLLTRREATKLKQWWERNGYAVSVRRISRNRYAIVGQR